MSKPATFAAIASLWESGGSRLATARAFADAIGLSWEPVYKWIERDFIDLRYWNAVIAAVAQHHGIILTKEDLHAMALATLETREKAKGKREAA